MTALSPSQLVAVYGGPALVLLVLAVALVCPEAALRWRDAYGRRER